LCHRRNLVPEPARRGDASRIGTNFLDFGKAKEIIGGRVDTPPGVDTRPQGLTPLVIDCRPSGAED